MCRQAKIVKEGKKGGKVGGDVDNAKMGWAAGKIIRMGLFLVLFSFRSSVSYAPRLALALVSM